jgi:hypothetical protein
MKDLAQSQRISRRWFYATSLLGICGAMLMAISQYFGKAIPMSDHGIGRVTYLEDYWIVFGIMMFSPFVYVCYSGAEEPSAWRILGAGYYTCGLALIGSLIGMVICHS